MRADGCCLTADVFFQMALQERIVPFRIGLMAPVAAAVGLPPDLGQQFPLADHLAGPLGQGVEQVELLAGQLEWAVLQGRGAGAGVDHELPDGERTLGALAGASEAADGEDRARAAAGVFLVAHSGFCVPPLLTGLAVDAFGAPAALGGFWGGLVVFSALLAVRLLRAPR